MNDKKMICNKCGGTFGAFSRRKKKAVVSDTYGSVIAIYYDCEVCGNKIVQSVENTELRHLLIEEQVIKFRLNNATKNTESFTSLLLDLKMTRKRITEIENNLLEQYQTI